MSDPNGTAQLESIALLHSKFDNLFKQIITAGWNVKSDGHVEAPTGHFGLVEVSNYPGEWAELRDAVFEDRADVNLFMEVPFGWYVAVENSFGFIYVYMMPDKARAELTFSKLEDEYSAWDAE